MKRSDIAVIILIAFFCAGIAYVAASALIGRPSNTAVKVKTANKISATVDQPDKSIFNKDAINPTVEVEIGGNNKK